MGPSWNSTKRSGWHRDVDDACRGTVLAADADPHSLEAVASIVTKLGFDVLRAGDGEQALTLLAEEAGSLVAVLVDVTLPQTGGVGILAAIRSLGLDVPVIICSSFDPTAASFGIELDRSTEILVKRFETPGFEDELTKCLQAACAPPRLRRN